MKRILILVMLAIATLQSSAQTWPNNYTRLNSNYYWRMGAFDALNLPTRDTSLLTGQWVKAGSIIFDSTQAAGSRVWVYNGMYWERLGAGGEGGGLSAVYGENGLTAVNDSTLAADTLILSTRAWRQKGVDSVAALPRVTSVGLTMPSAFSVSGSPVTSSGTLTVTGAGTTSQYIRGDGSLATYDAVNVSDSNFSISSNKIFYRNYVNVKDYGAVGDGVTDDATAFQDALNSNRPVYVPPGTYLIGTQVNMDNEQTLFGEGWASAIKVTANIKAIALDSTCVVKGLKFIGNGKAGTGTNNSGVLANDAVGWSIEDCYFYDFAGDESGTIGGAIGIGGLFSGNSDGGRVVNCYFLNNDLGINLDNRGEYVTIVGCTFGANDIGIYIKGGNNTITGNVIHNNRIGIYSSTGTNHAKSIITGNLMNHNTYSLDLNNVDHVLGMTLSANHFFLGSIRITSSSNVRFSNCEFENMDSIYLNNTSFIQIANSYIGSIINNDAVDLPIKKYGTAQDLVLLGVTRRVTTAPRRWINQVNADTVVFAGPVAIYNSTATMGGAALAIGGTDKGFLPPRLTTAQMSAIGSPAAGLLIYNTDSSTYAYYNGSGWAYLGTGSGGGGGSTSPGGSDTYIQYNDAGAFGGDATFTWDGNKVDVWNGGTTMVLGADANAQTRTNNTAKVGTITLPHYANAEEPITVYRASTSSGSNVLQMGYGQATENAVTEHRWGVGATATTTTGTEKMRLTANGLYVGTGANASAKLHIEAGTTSLAPLRFTSGTNKTTAAAGEMEYDGTNLYFTPTGTTRKRLAITNNATPSNGQIPIGNGTDYTAANITSTGGTITVTNGAGTIDLSIPTATLNSGTYTPTLTNTLNVSSSTAVELQYMRVGSTVTVSGMVTLDPTSSTSNTILELSLPIASNFTQIYQAGGTGKEQYGDTWSVIANTTNDTAQISGIPTSDVSRQIHFSFTYQIL